MKKCIVIPDSFKGTLSSLKICELVKNGIKEVFDDCEVVTIPIADGGEGTVDVFLNMNGVERIDVDATGPYGESIRTYFAKINDTAIIEMASVAGLTLVEKKENPFLTTTFGVGSIIKYAIDIGCKKIIVGLGGSCTNDMGVGMAIALGTKFLDEQGNIIFPKSNEFINVKDIEISKTLDILNGCEILGICDIDNPLYGENGAAKIFAPQKGADKNMVNILEYNIKYLSDLVEKKLNRKIHNIKGSGAAGGMGAGLIAFLGGRLKSGIDTILDIVEFEEIAKDADIIFTGEGRIDYQSIRGKAVIGIAKRAKKINVPVMAIVGSIGEGAEECYNCGVNSIISINIDATDYSISRYRSEENLKITVNSIARLIKAIEEKNSI